MKDNWRMSQSALAAITKYRRLSNSENKHGFLTVLETEKSKIKVLADLVPNERLPLPCGRCLLAVSSHGGERSSGLSLFLEGC